MKTIVLFGSSRFTGSPSVRVTPRKSARRPKVKCPPYYVRAVILENTDAQTALGRSHAIAPGETLLNAVDVED